MVVKKSEVKKIIKEKIIQKIHESPDIFWGEKGDRHVWRDDDAITFGYYDNILYTSEDIDPTYYKYKEHTHSDLGNWILSQVYDEDSPKPKGFENLSIERGDFKYAGRLWANEKVISFWEYPKTDTELDKIISDLNGKLKDIKIDDTWKLDLGFEDDNEFSRNSKLEPISSYKSSREATPADAGKAHIAFGKQGNVPSGVGSKFKFKNKTPGETVAQMRARTSINENKTKMKKSELQQIIREEISKVLKEENVNNENFIYKKDSGTGRPTMVLKLTPIGWEKVKHLFDSDGRPASTEVKRIPASGATWDLYTYEINGLHKIYGVSGDWTFGNAPTYYQQKHRGNIKAAKQVFDAFINKFLN